MESDVISACDNICRDFAWVGPLTEWLRNLAIIIGVWVGYYQLNAWRREHLLTTNAAVALDLFNAANETSKFISRVRNPMEALPPNSSFSDLVERKIQRYVDEFSPVEDLQKLQVKAEAFLGNDEIAASVEDLLSAVGKTKATLLTLRGYDGTPTGNDDTDGFYAELRQLMYERKDDEIYLKQEEAVRSLKSLLFPIIRLQKDK